MDISEIYDLLYRFGLTATNTYFFHTSYAIFLAVKQPERLLLPARWIYPEVAARYNTVSGCVECSIRFASATAWRENLPLLQGLAHRPLPQPPAPAIFLAILAAGFRSGSAA